MSVADGDEYDQEAIDRMAQALEQAWARVLVEQPATGARASMAAATRDVLARAVIEGTDQGIRSSERLSEFALRALPEFRF